MIFFKAFDLSIGFQSSLSFWLPKPAKKKEEGIDFINVIKKLYAAAVNKNGIIYLFPKHKGRFFPLFRYLAWFFLKGKNFIPIEITKEKINIIKSQNKILQELIKIDDEKKSMSFFSKNKSLSLLHDFIKRSDLGDGLYKLLSCKNLKEIKIDLPFLTPKISYIYYPNKIFTGFTENIYVKFNNNDNEEIKDKHQIGDFLEYKDGSYTIKKINYFNYFRENEKNEKNEKNFFNKRYDYFLPISGEFKPVETEAINENMKKAIAEEKDFKFYSLEELKEASNLLIFYYLVEEQMKNSNTSNTFNLERIDSLLDIEKININPSEESLEKISILLYGYQKEEDKKKANMENVKRNFGNILNIESCYEEFLLQHLGFSFLFQISSADLIKKVGNFLMKKDFICFRIICNLNIFAIVYNYYLNSVVSPMKVLETFFSISGEKYGIGFFVDFETIFYFLMKFLSEKNAKESALKYIKSIFSIFQIALSISFLDEKMLFLFYYEISSKSLVFNITFYPFSTKMRKLPENNKVNYDESSVPSFLY